MHVTSNNPTTTGGRQHRYSLGVVAHRHMASDATSERNLTTLGEYLAGATGEDRPSISSVLRRALAVYASHVRAITSDPVSLAYENTRVREGSRKPTLRKKPRAPRAPKIRFI